VIPTEPMNNTGHVQWNIGELYRAAKRELAALSDVPQTEALLLCGHFLGAGDRTALLLRGQEPVPQDTAEAFLRALSQREHRPLQYILGSWEFDGMELQVGEGVLVPREDTLALVELGCERLAAIAARRGEGEPLRILDLCAGTGAVGLAAARRLPGASVTCVELSDEALPYLRANAEKYGDGRVTVVQGDVLAGPAALGLAPGSFDGILSNPPYIPSADISNLAREVRQEPEMALNGGADGLDFYRAISELWKQTVRPGGTHPGGTHPGGTHPGGTHPGGVLCFELGEGQFEDVERMIVRLGWGDIGEKRDFSGKLRAIVGTKQP